VLISPFTLCFNGLLQVPLDGGDQGRRDAEHVILQFSHLNFGKASPLVEFLAQVIGRQSHRYNPLYYRKFCLSYFISELSVIFLNK